MNPVTSIEWRHSSSFRRPSVSRFGLHVHVSRPVVNHHDFGKLGVLEVIYPLKFSEGKCFHLFAHIRTGTRRLTCQRRKSDRIVEAIEGEKLRGKPQWYIFLQCPDDFSHSIVIKVGKIDDMEMIIKHAKFDVHWLSSAGSAGS
jgi:hypothetical protein